jgi:hypothetical protein
VQRSRRDPAATDTILMMSTVRKYEVVVGVNF